MKVTIRKSRPEFKNISSFDEFITYYWYHKELRQICKSLGLEYRGTKQELNTIIKEYFSGNFIKKTSTKNLPKKSGPVAKDTPLLTCRFSFNATFRAYFSALTGVEPFHFTADMAAAWRKVKSENDTAFTIQDMLDIYNGTSDYAQYDHTVCQWNQFVKDFYMDPRHSNYSDPLKAAAILWQAVKTSTQDKKYTSELFDLYFDKIKKYRK